MRLWHEKLIPYLDEKSLLDLHYRCCELRGENWKEKLGSGYVFNHPYSWFILYHWEVLDEIKKRGIINDSIDLWYDVSIRGAGKKAIGGYEWRDLICSLYLVPINKAVLYPEHNEAYLQECLDNLAGKGIIINREDIK